VQQRCVVPLPMPVPLPFPRLFGPAVARYGDTLRRQGQPVSQQQPGHRPQQQQQPQQHPQQQSQRPEANSRAAGGGAPDAVVSVPELTRLAADAQFREVLRLQRRQLASAAGQPAFAPPVLASRLSSLSNAVPSSSTVPVPVMVPAELAPR
jgi:hypothetical protein